MDWCSYARIQGEQVRILILGLNYLPESTSIGPYTADLAEYLKDQGHQVQVITGFPMAPQWRIWDGYRGRLVQREVIHGVPVTRVYLYIPREPRRAMSRVLFDLSFSVSALLGGIFSGPCDVVIAISPPLQIGLSGWLISRLKRAALFFHIQDLVPDAAVATGMLSENSRPVKIARMMERFVYKRARAIGVICDGFKRNLVSKHVPIAKVKLLPNYIDLNFMRPTGPSDDFRNQYAIARDEFLVMYSGSIALKQGLEILIDAAARLADEQHIRFMIVGEGPSLDDLKAKTGQLGLTNVTFLPLQPRESLPQQLSAADVLVITQKRAVTDIVFPGKLLYYMAAGRPIVAAVSADSETGRFITEYQVGVVTPPEEPAELAAAILRLSWEDIRPMGARGRDVVEAKFDRRVVLPAFMECLTGLKP